MEGTAPVYDWIAESRIQVGDPHGAPWAHMPAFLDGFVAALTTAGADNPQAVPDTANGWPTNPTRLVQFGLQAPDEDAAHAAADAFFRAAFESALRAVPNRARAFGWMASTGVQPA